MVVPGEIFLLLLLRLTLQRFVITQPEDRSEAYINSCMCGCWNQLSALIAAFPLLFEFRRRMSVKDKLCATYNTPFPFVQFFFHALSESLCMHVPVCMFLGVMSVY